MSIDAFIRDGHGTKSKAKVTGSGAVHFIENPFPPFGGVQKMRVFRQLLTDDGTSSGSSDMDVDGSATSQDFFISADDENDIYICVLSFVIADATQSLNEFANTNNPLTNGCRLFYSDNSGEVDIHDSLKTNFDFVRLCLGTPPIGATTTAFRANNVSGNSEGYIPFLDLRQLFGFRWGIRLAAGTGQRLSMRINDDCTAADQFDCIAYGFERVP